MTRWLCPKGHPLQRHLYSDRWFCPIDGFTMSERELVAMARALRPDWSQEAVEPKDTSTIRLQKNAETKELRLLIQEGESEIAVVLDRETALSLGKSMIREAESLSEVHPMYEEIAQRLDITVEEIQRLVREDEERRRTEFEL